MPRVAMRDPNDPWWRETRASQFLDRLFESFFKKLGVQDVMRKTDYHVLARLVAKDLIDPEVTEKLDLLVAVARSARPVRGPEDE